MTIFYQHIGEAMWQRDVPRTIGTAKDGLRRFRWPDIERDLTHLDPYETIIIQGRFSELAPAGCQIWGIPSGAQHVLDRMGAGDFLLLRESAQFGYVGQVLHRVSQPCYQLSRRLWGEERFPLVVLLQGELINYGWDDFKEHFGIASSYFMTGGTATLAAKRISESPSNSEDAFIAMLLTTTGVRTGLEPDFRIFANNLQAHFRLVKERARQQSFRTSVLTQQGERCAVCDMSILVVLDGAHVVPKQHDGSDDCRNGLALCVLHHRMFDANLFSINPAELTIHTTSPFTLADLRITRCDIKHLSSKPHRDALEWRWNTMEIPASS